MDRCDRLSPYHGDFKRRIWWVGTPRSAPDGIGHFTDTSSRDHVAYSDRHGLGERLVVPQSLNKRVLLLTLPGAVVGIVIGGLLAGYVNDQFVRVCVGIIAIAFPIYAIFKPKGRASFMKDNKPIGVVAGSLSGFTSFIAHAGGPPFQAYAIPQDLEKRIYAGTAVMFFFVVNMVKVVPYAMLGQFDSANLTTAFILMPLAPVGVLIGVWLVKQIDQDLFFRIIYLLIFGVGLKLLWDGLMA